MLPWPGSGWWNGTRSGCRPVLFRTGQGTGRAQRSPVLGKGQELRLGFTLSSYRNEIDLGFTEPYFMGRNIAAGIDVFRRDLNSFRYTSNNDRDTTYEEVTTGFQLRVPRHSSKPMKPTRCSSTNSG